MKDTADLTAILDRLFQEGQRVLADFAALAEQPVADGDMTEDVLERLREQSRRYFEDMKRQWQDQAQPWIAMLRAWAQLSDGATPAELMMAPMAWWRPTDHNAASSASDTSRQHRVEAAAAELAAARDDYLAQLQQAAEGAIERFAVALRALDSPPSLRQLYQLWLTAAESAYEEVLASEEFAQATGRLTNAWSELLLILQEDLDGMLRSTGLPTRRELTETQAQIHELRREQRRRERELRADLDALRARLDAAELQPSPPKAPARRAAPRKRAPGDV